jgi:hypothetical protein
MTDWKAIGIGALINAVLTIVLTIVLFPLFFLGPVIGGFLATYMAQDNYGYYSGNPTEGAADGAVSGVIGGAYNRINFYFRVRCIKCNYRTCIYTNRISCRHHYLNNRYVHHICSCDRRRSSWSYWWSNRAFSKGKGINNG